MFGDLMAKMQEAQEQMAASKARLNNVLVEAEVEGGLIKVVATGGKQIKSLSISPELMADNDVEAIEDLLITAINKALTKADELSDGEMQNMAQSMMPGLTDLLGQ